MDGGIRVQPLPYRTRHKTFLLLVFIFIVSLPFLYLYATGYRFDLTKPTNIISTGGIYVAVDRTGAEIYVDDELVRETRSFRKAFYAQSLDIGTHRVHVQKEGHHTWVKELPVSKHLVTEAQAFNLPLVPQVRVISKWQTATGTMIISHEITNASSTNAVIATSTKNTRSFVQNPEFTALIEHFGTTSTSTQRVTAAEQIKELLTKDATTTPESTATSTIISGGVKLYRNGDDLFATWVGPFEQMPYYYCAPDFPRYGTSTDATTTEEKSEESFEVPPNENQPLVQGPVMHPVQTIPKGTECDPTIRIDRKWQAVHDFDFYPRSTDLVVTALDDAVNVVEIDDRSWQNVQPLFIGNNLKLHIENGNIYVYDGELIYQILLPIE